MSFSEWKEVRLGDVITFNPRESIAKKQMAKKIAMEKLKPFTKFIDSYELTEFNGGTKFRNGDTLLARITPCLENGKTSQVTTLDDNEVGFGSTEYIILREKVGITNKDYIYYLSISPKFRDIAIKSMVGSSGRQRVQQDMLENTEVLLPSLAEQKAIADTLSCLDNKIELNNSINKTLEEMAQTIFKSWFVDFEPFQDGEFEDSELGRIPKGWKVGILSECCEEIVRGFTSKYVEYGKIKNLNQKVNKGSYLDKQYYKYLREDIDIPNNKFAQRYDILLNCLGQGTLGRVHLFTDYEDNIVVDQHITIIRAGNGSITSIYLYLLLSTPLYQNLLEGLITGSTGMLMLNISKVRNLKVVIPTIDILNEFDVLVKCLMEKKSVLNSECDSLSAIRDALLPKLMSREIRVPTEKVK